MTRLGIVVTIMMVITLIFGIAGYFIYQSDKKVAEQDANGCLINLGYSWCEEKNKCLKGSEEKCEIPSEVIGSILSESQAREIAESTCIKGGESLTPGYYNNNSRTWWFDANLNATQEGCNPACVVSEEMSSAEINWRCTGLISQTGSAEEIEQLFVKKYIQYRKTLSVSVNAEDGNFVRGSVIFEPGMPGGNFLAVKIDGEWQIVFDGNGQIPCTLEEYGFPAGMLLDCAR